MRPFPYLSTFVALLSTAGPAAAQLNEGEWVSYRDAYRAMVVFEKYGKAKHLIQNHLQVMPKEKGVAPEGLQLTLLGKSTSLNLPLDATGRTVFPLLKAAYDENAALVLNHPVSQYWFRARVSIVVRQDGVYEAGDLRAACEQALAYQRSIDAALNARRCSGVRFIFGHGVTDPGVRVRKGEGDALASADGPAFPGDAYEGFKVVSFRFGGAGEKSHVVTQNAPLAINPTFE
jgi:hypothetical protein